MSPVPGQPDEEVSLEVWGGVECTHNRVGNAWFDQLDRTGHSTRLDDLARFAGLGIQAIRYPVLWERTAPDPARGPDWSWPDERLAELRRLGLRPIVGLVHHGSGPAHTNLLDPAWPELLAAYAAQVAERYPWVEDWTPVNEPLTTARFSALYGHWYPHTRDDLAFARALLHQLKGVVLAMEAIRRVSPAARLLQTEDLTHVRAATPLAYQAEFENERRWLTFDFLTGRVKPGHPMHHFFRWSGVTDPELDWFLEHPLPPDMLGFNYYVVSERYLEPAEGLPAQVGNGRDPYRDIEAVRRLGILGLAHLLGEAWERYHLPMAVTEAHLAGTREEQLRWLAELWEQGHRARADGVDVRALTAWSLLGAWDWDRLCTSECGRYEPGAFDIRSRPPRPTALARLVSRLAAGERLAHPVLEMEGWWRRA